MQKKSYNTAGRAALIDFLSSHPDEQFTAEQLCLAIYGDENSRKSPWRRAVKGLNSGTRIFFENLDGTTDDGVADEDLPYDVKADPVTIGDEDFGTFYLDALEHPERYDGKRIHARGRAFRMNDMPKNCYVDRKSVV